MRKNPHIKIKQSYNTIDLIFISRNLISNLKHHKTTRQCYKNQSFSTHVERQNRWKNRSNYFGTMSFLHSILSSSTIFKRWFLKTHCKWGKFTSISFSKKNELLNQKFHIVKKNRFFDFQSFILITNEAKILLKK